MLNHISIELELESMTYSNQIVGNIGFVIDYYDYFPGHGWSDFVGIVLTWWIDQCRALLFAPLHESYSFDFMDGSVRVLAKKMTVTEVELTFIEDRHSKTRMGTVSIEEIKHALIKASHQLINAVDRNGWRNEEIEQLRHAVKTLQTY